MPHTKIITITQFEILPREKKLPLTITPLKNPRGVGPCIIVAKLQVADVQIMKKITLQRATTDDIDIYLAIEKSVGAGRVKTYSGVTNEKEARDEIEENVVYLIKKDDQIVGSIQYQLEGMDRAHITGLVVDPRFQEQGIGREALTQIFDELKDARRIDLVTHPHNTPAIMLYLSFGFVIESWKDDYFGDGEPRIVLSRIKKEGEA